MLKLRIIGILNFVIFQWLFIRFYFEFTGYTKSQIQSGEEVESSGFGVLFALPMTGWSWRPAVPKRLKLWSRK